MEKNVLSSIELIEARLRSQYKDLYDHLASEVEKMLQINLVKNTNTYIRKHSISHSIDFDRMLDDTFKALSETYLGKKGYSAIWLSDHVLDITLYI